MKCLYIAIYASFPIKLTTLPGAQGQKRDEAPLPIRYEQ